MATSTTSFRCSECGHESPRWFGRCPECGSWAGSMPSSNGHAALQVTSLEVATDSAPRIPSGLGEVDRVLGGGLVTGSVGLLAGEPGIGKSTLILQLLDALASRNVRCLLVAGEESLGQVALRGRRISIDASRLPAASSSSVQAITAAVAKRLPQVLVIDSIQSMTTASIEGLAGSVSQVRAVAGELASCARANGVTVVVVGHVTKDGAVAGPKTLEHLVDVVLMLEGDRSGGLRLLRATKNRFGSTEETGVFLMEGDGLRPVPDPSALMLEDRREHVPGSVVFCGLEGSRPLLIDIQALVPKSQLARRVGIGIDARRLLLLIGVLTEHAQVNLGERDVFVASAGGLPVREPAADLAICLALHSMFARSPVHRDLVAMGEVGLSGEVRRVPGIERRLVEAARLGFKRALVPRGSASGVKGLVVKPVSDIAMAIELARAPA